jgi:asparagine synthase (glutamine-hydrolysing)
MADIDASLYLFCRQIKQTTTVGLSGECADEILGGYPWFDSEETLAEGAFPWIRMIETRCRYLSPEIIRLIQPEEYVNDRYQDSLREVPALPEENRSRCPAQENVLHQYQPVHADSAGQERPNEHGLWPRSTGAICRPSFS